MKRYVAPVSVAAALVLTGCAGIPADTSDDTQACKEYARVISDWAVSGGSGATAAGGVAMKLRSEVMPLASDELRGSLDVMAETFEAFKGDDYTDEELGAAENIVTRCEELGVTF